MQAHGAGGAITLPFTQAPCKIHYAHTPVCLITQQHHVFPLELQKLVWPDVDRDKPATIRGKITVPLCGTGHDNVHERIRELMKDPRTRQHGGQKEWRLAHYAVYELAIARSTVQTGGTWTQMYGTTWVAD
jgi:hypothetical protein